MTKTKNEEEELKIETTGVREYLFMDDHYCVHKGDGSGDLIGIFSYREDAKLFVAAKKKGAKR